jgi:hypothetical protein
LLHIRIQQLLIRNPAYVVFPENRRLQHTSIVIQ